MMLSTPTPTKRTIWIWPTGIFPRRIVFSLKAKDLPLSLLCSPENENGELRLITMILDKQGIRLADPSSEEKPAGCSLPVVRAERNGVHHLIRQSVAVLEYLEECYPASGGYKDLSGATTNPETKATIRDIMQLVTEAVSWIGFWLCHTHPFNLTWSGMKKEDQIETIGADAKRRWMLELTKLESWVKGNVTEKGSLGLVGTDTPTLADFCLVAPIDYFKEMYGINILEDLPVLATWFERYSSSQWYVSRDELGDIEKEGFASLFSSV